MKFTNIYTGPDGKSHFKEMDLELKDIGKRRKRSKVTKVTGLVFNETEAGSELEWHNAPQRQFVITLAGEVEITASDGTVRRFGPGGIMLAEDTTGKGHMNRVISKEPRKFIGLALE